MRLLNTTTLELKEFFDNRIPKYAILSHTWGDDEVSLRDLKRSYRKKKLGFAKITGCCAQAISRNYDWVWIDTCCIDKTSSAELSEAINSMFRWYQGAQECFVYLSDVQGTEDLWPLGSAFRASRWFTRGWTLQELLAPRYVTFFESSWTSIGTKTSITSLISFVTNIPENCLRDNKFIPASPIAQRMSWASKRTTSRVEDMAYCLLGLVDVNMPLLYGEGTKAFVRLQEEIIRTTYDHSILAWGLGLPLSEVQGASDGTLATSPVAFNAWYPEVLTGSGGNHYLPTNLGLHIELPTIMLGDGLAVALLDCKDHKRDKPDGNTYSQSQVTYPLEPCRGTGGASQVALPLELCHRTGGAPLARRARGVMPFLVDNNLTQKVSMVQLYLGKLGSNYNKTPTDWIDCRALREDDYDLTDYFPPNDVEMENGILYYKRVLLQKQLFHFKSVRYADFILLCTFDEREVPFIKTTVLRGQTRWQTIWQHALELDSKEVKLQQIIDSFSWSPSSIGKYKLKIRPGGAIWGLDDQNILGPVDPPIEPSPLKKRKRALSPADAALELPKKRHRCTESTGDKEEI